MTEKPKPEYTEFNQEHTRALEAHEAYEKAFHEHAFAMVNLQQGGQFNEEHALNTADELQEAMFEMVEAGFSHELSELRTLAGELVASERAAAHHGYASLAKEFRSRLNMIADRIIQLEEGEY